MLPTNTPALHEPDEDKRQLLSTLKMLTAKHINSHKLTTVDGLVKALDDFSLYNETVSNTAVWDLEFAGRHKYA